MTTTAPNEVVPIQPPEQTPLPDKLVLLVESEIDEEVRRITAQTPTLEQLQLDLARTALSMLRDLGVGVLKFRNWAAYSNGQHSDHLDDHEARLLVLESILIGGETQLAPDDADMFAKVTVAAEAFAEEALTKTTDPGGRAKLEEVLELCTLAKQRIEETTIPADDEDETDYSADGDAAADDDGEAVVATPSAPGE